MRIYLSIWVGEVASTVGSALTSFALGLWIYEQTDSVSLFTLNVLAYVLPGLLLTPIAGVIADRWNRKWVIVLGDAGVALTTLGVFLLAATDHLHIAAIYLLTAISSACGSLQWPAYAAAIPLIVPKEHLGRASALSQSSEGLAEMAAPAIAGSLYVMGGVGLQGILLIDFATFAFSTLILILAPIPRHRRVIEFVAEPGTDPSAVRQIIRESMQGWHYIVQRPGLLGLLLYFAALNFFEDLLYPLAQPLLFETASPDAAGRAMSQMAIGMLIGVGIMAVWGGPRRRVHGILIPGVLSGLVIAAAGLQPSLGLITAAGFGYFLLLPIIEGSDQALWQTKVAADMQGRVFAMQGMIASSIRPLALLLAGPLADNVFEPAMRENGVLAGSVGQVIGTGPGRGIGLFIILMGLLSAVAALVAYLNPRIRRVDSEIPDAEILTEAAPGMENAEQPAV